MKIIKRDYLNRLIRIIGTPDIKVITGIRRSGKSNLLEEFKKYIEDNLQANIIYVNFSLLEYDYLKEYKELNKYITEHYIENIPNFVLIDEVQMCRGFEATINSLHASGKYDIYITGSNAFLSSNDLATLFTGRTFDIKIYPFSFKEYMEYYSDFDIETNFNNYVLLGGMSGSYLYQDTEDKYKYIKDIYETLIIRDIKQKYNIKDEELVEKITDYLMSNISNLTSALNVTNTLNSNKISTSDKTVGNYISYLCNTYLFYKIGRYDINGKKYLSSNHKYYLCDTSFKYAILGTKNMDYGRNYENIVAIELLRRGYLVYVGILHENEVDFVAIKKDEKIYIQVSDDISNEETFKREVTPLLKIKDAYPKMIIARTKHDKYQYEGIEIIDIANWLME